MSNNINKIRTLEKIRLSKGMYAGKFSKHLRRNLDFFKAAKNNFLEIDIKCFLNSSKILIELLKFYQTNEDRLLLIVEDRPYFYKDALHLANILKASCVLGKWTNGLFTNNLCIQEKHNILLNKIPDLVLIMNLKNSSNLLNECEKRGIPCIATMSGWTKIDKVTYPVMINSESILCYKFINEILKESQKYD